LDINFATSAISGVHHIFNNLSLRFVHSGHEIRILTVTVLIDKIRLKLSSRNIQLYNFKRILSLRTSDGGVSVFSVYFIFNIINFVCFWN
ncbi:hypothetical protein L9F63_014225, partial [Diploptera punctata]